MHIAGKYQVSSMRRSAQSYHTRITEAVTERCPTKKADPKNLAISLKNTYAWCSLKGHTYLNKPATASYRFV